MSGKTAPSISADTSFAGWIVPRDTMQLENRHMSAMLFRAWMFLIRYVCPLLVGAILG